MKLIEADKVEQAIKDYWKAQVDRLPIPKSIEEHDAYVNCLDAILERNDGLLKAIDELPSAQPDLPIKEKCAFCPHCNNCDVNDDLSIQPCVDTISRQAVKYKLTALVNEFEEILSHIREREGDDSVCGLCEYDGAYIGQSGDWCNECPGFDKDDCFKLKDKYREEWMSIDG